MSLGQPKFRTGFFLQPSEKKVRLEREYTSRQAKRERRPKKLYTMSLGEDGGRKGKGETQSLLRLLGPERERVCGWSRRDGGMNCSCGGAQTDHRGV